MCPAAAAAAAAALLLQHESVSALGFCYLLLPQKIHITPISVGSYYPSATWSCIATNCTIWLCVFVCVCACVLWAVVGPHAFASTRPNVQRASNRLCVCVVQTMHVLTPSPLTAYYYVTHRSCRLCTIRRIKYYPSWHLHTFATMLVPFAVRMC